MKLLAKSLQEPAKRGATVTENEPIRAVIRPTRNESYTFYQKWLKPSYNLAGIRENKR